MNCSIISQHADTPIVAKIVECFDHEKFQFLAFCGLILEKFIFYKMTMIKLFQNVLILMHEKSNIPL